MKTNNPKNYEQAKQAAQRIYKRINYDGGNLQTYQLSSLLQQTYDFLKIPFKPTTNDLKQYAKVLDANGDGAVSLQDMQLLSVQYLCGDGVLGASQTGKRLQSSQYSASSYQNVQSNDYTNSNLNQNARGLSKFDTEEYNYGSSNQYGSGSQYNDQSYMNSGYNQYGGNQENAYMGKNNFSGSGTANFQYGGSSFNTSGADLNQFGKSSYSGTSNTYANPQGYSSVSQTQQHLASRQYNEAPVIAPQKSKYTPIAQNYLNITRSLFAKYANNSSGTITRDRVAQLLNQTYSALGRKGYHPSEEDINVWMKLCDTNSDGHVEEAEYEYFVVRALERSGVQVNA